MKQANHIGALVVVITTVANETDAQTIARSVIEARLAACVQCVPIRSVYRWKGNVEDSQEVQLLIKTPTGRKDALLSWLGVNHSYETPEILVQSIQDVSASYLAWAEAETSQVAG